MLSPMKFTRMSHNQTNTYYIISHVYSTCNQIISKINKAYENKCLTPIFSFRLNTHLSPSGLEFVSGINTLIISTKSSDNTATMCAQVYTVSAGI